MANDDKHPIPEALKDLALPAGVLLVVTILGALGVTDDLLGRLMRNDPDALTFALTLALIGVSLPAVGRLIIETADPTAARMEPATKEPAGDRNATLKDPTAAAKEAVTKEPAADGGLQERRTSQRGWVVKMINMIKNRLKLLLDRLRH